MLEERALDEVSPVLMAMGAQSLLKAATPPAHAPASEEDVTRANKEREDAAREVIEILGFVPGAWGMMSLATLSVDAIARGSIAEGLIGLIFCIPTVGPALRRLGITHEEVIQSGKIPAEMAEVVASHADEIQDAISRLDEVLPYSDEVKAVVEELLRRARVGDDIDIISLRVRDATARAAPLEGFAKELINDPRWKKWAIDIARPAVTDVLNDIVSKEFGKRVIGGMTYGMPADVKAKFLSSKEAILHNDRVIAIAKSELPKIVDNISKTLRINFVLDPEVAAQTGGKALGHLSQDTSWSPVINIFVPQHLTADAAKSHIVREIHETVAHELDHFVVDKQLHAAFAKGGVLENEFLYVSETSARISQVLRDIISSLGIPAAVKDEMPETLVKIRSFRRGMGTKMFTAADIEAVATGDLPEFIADRMRPEGYVIADSIRSRHARLMQLAPQVDMLPSDPEFVRRYLLPFYEKTASLLNKVP